MTAHLAHDTLKQRVARGMAMGIIDDLQTDDVGIRSDQRATRSAGTVNLAVELRCPLQTERSVRDLISSIESLRLDETRQYLEGAGMQTARLPRRPKLDRPGVEAGVSSESAGSWFAPRIRAPT